MSVLFPNDEPLFADPTESLEDFLARMNRRGTLEAKSPEVKAPRLRLNLITNFGRLKFAGKYHRPNRRAGVKIDPARTETAKKRSDAAGGGAA